MTAGESQSGLELPDALRPFLGTTRFWTDFFWVTEPKNGEVYAPLDKAVVRFHVGAGRALELDLGGLSYFELWVVGPEGREQLAWDDQAQWHPDVLRWEELDVISRAVAALDPSVDYPALPVLLLQRFAPICGDDDATLAFSLLEQAWERLGLFRGRELRDLVERGDRRGHGFAWSRSGERYVLGQSGEHEYALYTLRHAENDEFPFGMLASLVGAAEETARRPGRPVRVALRAAPTPRVRTTAALDVATKRNGRTRLPSSGGHYFAQQVEAALRTFGVGGTAGTGWLTGSDEEVTTERYSLDGHPEKALELAKAALLWARAPGDATLRCGDLDEQLENFHPDAPTLHVRARRVRVTQYYSGGLIVHYLGEPLPARSSTTAWLAGLTDDNGYRAVELSDGGKLTVRTTGEPDEPDGISCIVERLTLDVCLLLVDLSRADELLLFPMLLTASEKRASELEGRWPGTELVREASDLFAILEQGPRAFWESRGPVFLPELGSGPEAPKKQRNWWEFWK
jgi:hypothetical protein